MVLFSGDLITVDDRLEDPALTWQQSINLSLISSSRCWPQHLLMLSIPKYTWASQVVFIQHISSMRLLHTKTLQIEEISDSPQQKYAILSHIWGRDEVTFEEMSWPGASLAVKAGFRKIKRFCDTAQRHGFEYVWVDTCCIDKRNSAELSEAINSMYRYYEQADECFIYLVDVPPIPDRAKMLFWLHMSEWHTRGWTLQELLASTKRRFFATDWSEIENHDDLIKTISRSTGVDQKVLEDPRLIPTICLAERMSWVSTRRTTRPEDMAYCLLGIFNISMPILYGEGLGKAFRRLQMEIMQVSFDQTLFAWRGPYAGSGLLATSPQDFRHVPELRLWSPEYLSPYTMTNIGLTIRVLDVTKLVVDKPPSDASFLASIQCEGKNVDRWMGIAVYLQPVIGMTIGLAEDGRGRRACRRVKCDEWYWVGSEALRNAPYEDIVVLQDEHHRLAQQIFR